MTYDNIEFLTVSSLDSAIATVNDYLAKHHITKPIIAISVDTSNVLVAQSINEAKQSSAEEYIESPSLLHAIPYHDMDNAPAKSSKHVELEERLEQTMLDKANYMEQHYVGDFKHKLVTCQQCESKIATKWLPKDKTQESSNDCPVCGHTLLSDYVIERLDKYNKSIKDLTNQIHKYEQNRIKQSPINYLIPVVIVD